MSDQAPPPNPSTSSLTNPQDDADRIRLKRLAKLQSSSPSSSTPSSLRSSPPPPVTPPKPKPIPPPSKRQFVEPQPVFRTPQPSPKPAAPAKFDSSAWEVDTIQAVLQVTLKSDQMGLGIVWLQGLAQELEAEETPLRLSSDIIDRLIISRLEHGSTQAILDPLTLTTSFEYLVGCWKRLQAVKTSIMRRGYSQSDIATATLVIEKLKELIVSYAGFSLQDPMMFYQPPGKTAGFQELLAPLQSLASNSPLTSFSSSSSTSSLEPSEIQPFLADLAARFDGDGLDEILGPVFVNLTAIIKADQDGLGGTGMAGGWRSALAGIEGLVAVKPIAGVMTRIDAWYPVGLTSAFLEHLTLIGPAARLSVFGREWPNIMRSYFPEPEKLNRPDLDSTNTNLRATLHVFQQSLFTIFNAAVRSGVPAREKVLQYFADTVNLNLKRGGSHVDPSLVASDGFMINLQTSLLRLAEPFLDAKFTKIDKVDPLYLIRPSRLLVAEETRIKATSDDVKVFAEQIQQRQLAAPGSANFITEIFYLTAAFNHYGFVRTLATHDDHEKLMDDITKHLERLESDTSYAGTPMEPQFRAAIAKTKAEKEKVYQLILAYQVQLLDADLIFRMIGFTTFMMAWLIRLVDPQKKYPDAPVTLPLPAEPPKTFISLPEYFIEDIVEFYYFLVRYTPGSMDLSGKKEVVEFILTFLTSTWYIKNPHLKARLVQIMFYGTLSYGRDKMGVLGPVLNSHPMALKHLVPALMAFYVEVEHTGASSQFYDKFDARRNIAYILKAIWNNPDHRAALNREVDENIANFIRFANLLMNDCTYLLDESLSKLAEIRRIQKEMEEPSWATRTPEDKKERLKVLQQAEGQATSYITLGKSTVGLLRDFTAQAKAPFMAPEIVDRLAAMLNYNLDALVGPKTSNIHVKNMNKYRFQPRELLGDVISVYINLSEQPEFIRAVATEGRSYKKSIFERAAHIAQDKALKSTTEAEQLILFVTKVEETKLLVEAEEDLGEVPDEYLDPLMYTLMRDPVKLPSSRTTVDRSTIKAHLLSDPTDPFNRSPLTIDDVVPDDELKQKIKVWLEEKRGCGMDLNQPEVSPNSGMDVDDQVFDAP